MATDIDNLKSIRSAILAAIAANPTALDYTIEGQSVSRASLWDRLDRIDRAMQSIQGPVILETNVEL